MANCRCREHTEALVEEGTLGALWDEYGIVGDLVVSFGQPSCSSIQ